MCTTVWGGTHARCMPWQDAHHVMRTRWCVTLRPGAVAADGAAAALQKTCENGAGFSKKATTKKKPTTHKRILRRRQLKNHLLALLSGSSFPVEPNDQEAAAGKQARPAFERRRRFCRLFVN